MDLSPTDEQQFLREAVRGSVDRDITLARVREQVLEGDVDHRSAHEHAVAQGWTGIGVPEDLGGQGGSLLELAILAEELGRGGVPADGLYASILVSLALARGGDDGAADVVGRLAGGGTTGALVVPAGLPLDAGARASEPATAPVLGAPLADTLVVPTVNGGLAVHEDVTAPDAILMVDRTRSLGTVSLPGEPTATFAGPDTDGWTDLAAWAAVVVAADALGAAQRQLDLTVAYVADRVQFGVAVGSFQAVKHAAADMLVAIEGLRVIVQYAAWAVGEGEPGGHLDAWAAKARAARAASLVSDKALFLHGAVGYTWEHDLHLLFKRCKSDAVLFGAAGVYDDRIADALELVS